MWLPPRLPFPIMDLLVNAEAAPMTLQRKSDVSPSSTMDELPTYSTAPPSPVTQSSGSGHMLTIREGMVFAYGGSSLCEEGETFVAHLGLGEDCEWGEPVPTPTPVAMPEGVLGAPVEVAAGNLHSLVLCGDVGAARGRAPCRCVACQQL